MDPISSDYVTMHAHKTPAASSPKRKRAESTSLSAAETIFAPDLPVFLPIVRDCSTVDSSLPSHIDSTKLELPQSNTGLSSSFPQNPHFETGVEQAPPTAPEIRALENEAQAYPDSPRSAVARKLAGLDLALHPEIPVRPFPVLNFGERDGAKKKLRLDVSESTERISDGEEAKTLDHAGVRAGSPSRVAPRSKTSHISGSPSKPTGIAKPKIKRSKSPPLPSKPFDPDTALTNIIWWTDAEITGHLGLDPEDDGYGINGVGFRPTPAMATARSIKRRRQVDQWKIRELREERRRRADGRNGRVRGASVEPVKQVHGNDSLATKPATRTVRFA